MNLRSNLAGRSEGLSVNFWNIGKFSQQKIVKNVGDWNWFRQRILLHRGSKSRRNRDNCQWLQLASYSVSSKEYKFSQFNGRKFTLLRLCLGCFEKLLENFIHIELLNFSRISHKVNSNYAIVNCLVSHGWTLWNIKKCKLSSFPIPDNKTLILNNKFYS